MELGLSLGDTSKPFTLKANKKPLGFCMGLSIGSSHPKDVEKHADKQRKSDVSDENEATKLPLQLELLPHTPVPRSHGHLPWPPSENVSSEGGSSGHIPIGLDVNMMPMGDEGEEDGGTGTAATSSSPNSAASSFHQMDLCIFRGSGHEGNKRDCDEALIGNYGEAERTSSRASDEDDNGSTRKKLRLSKEQSAFLEESFKEHSTLNPKQKLALANQLGLRPRQVEVWFQNRRARTKLKQTEVDCEYLKRCCETLTEENRRLHKELHELRALKTSNPYYMQLPATTLTMCPSCERVATTSTTSTVSHNATAVTANTISSSGPNSKSSAIFPQPARSTTQQHVLPLFSQAKPS